MVVRQKNRHTRITLENEKLEQVEESTCLGSVMSADGKCVTDVKRRISLTPAMVNKFSKLWRSTGISNETKVKLYETFVVTVLLYGSECCCLRKEDERQILTVEMTWSRTLLRVTRRDKMRNETVRGILCQETKRHWLTE